MSRISVGVIGFGRMGRNHARVFSELRDSFEVIGAFDPVPGPFDARDASVGCRANASARIPVTPFATAEALIASSALVIVAAPTPMHGALVRMALDRGRSVLVEKPIASTALEARRLAAFAESRGCALFVGHSERFNPVVRAIRAWLTREPAAMTAIAIERFVPFSASTPDGQGSGEPAREHAPANVDDDVLLNLGVHDLDLVEHLTGARAVLRGATGDGSSSRIHLTAGSTFVTLRCGRDGERKRTVRITTDAVTLEGDLLSPRLVALDRRTNAKVDLALSMEEALRAQALAIHAALSGAASSLATGTDGARAVELAERAMILRDRRRSALGPDSAQPDGIGLP